MCLRCNRRKNANTVLLKKIITKVKSYCFSNDHNAPRYNMARFIGKRFIQLRSVYVCVDALQSISGNFSL